MSTPTRLKLYRRHRCDTRHRSFNKLARCIWPRAGWISGEGRYALLAHCRVLTVTLWDDPAEAERQKRFIDETACGGLCRRSHEIVELVDPDRAIRWEG